MRRFVLTLVVAALLLPLQAWGQDAELKKIENLYDDMEFEDARKAIDVLLKRDDLQPAQVVRALRVRGLSLSAEGATDESLECFKQLLAIRPDFKLSADISPKLAAPFYQALAMAQSFGPIAVEHKKPDKVDKLDGLALKAELKDPYNMIGAVRLVYRVGTSAWIKTAPVTVRGAGPLSLKLPGALGKDELSYYFEALSPSGSVYLRSPLPEEAFNLKPGASTAVADAGGETGAGGAVDFGGGDDLRDDGSQDKGAAFYETWWFWTAVGVVVVGAGVGLGVGLAGGGDPSGPQDYAINIR